MVSHKFVTWRCSMSICWLYRLLSFCHCGISPLLFTYIGFLWSCLKSASDLHLKVVSERGKWVRIWCWSHLCILFWGKKTLNLVEQRILHDRIRCSRSWVSEKVADDDFWLHTFSTSIKLYVSEALQLCSIELWFVGVRWWHEIFSFLS